MFKGIYKIKQEKVPEIKSKYKEGYMAKEIGICIAYLSNIMTGKKKCSKVIAYCIVKLIDENAEVEDFFDIEIGD